jgi:peroxiredoxin
MTVSAGMSGTAAMSTNAQMVENAWTKSQIDLKTVAFTKNGEFTQHHPNSPNELFWCKKQPGQ